jgi:hypothetical protein
MKGGSDDFDARSGDMTTECHSDTVDLDIDVLTKLVWHNFEGYE